LFKTTKTKEEKVALLATTLPTSDRELVESGDIHHISAFFATPLFDLFDDPENKGWTQPSEGMRGNGFCWGQQAHLLGWIFHVCPALTPAQVYCQMTHSKNSGADIAHSATVTCSKDGDSDSNDVVMSISGTAMLPGGAHKEEPTGKLVRIMLFGSKGAIIYAGDDRDPSSGQLELRLHENNGDVQTPAGNEFHFENIEKEGLGSESLQNFIKAPAKERISTKEQTLCWDSALSRSLTLCTAATTLNNRGR
jgi:predicted dehydrogenase